MICSVLFKSSTVGGGRSPGTRAAAVLLVTTTTTVVAVVTTSFWTTITTTTRTFADDERHPNNYNKNKNNDDYYKIEADLMDKIAAKSYIQQRNPNPNKRPKGVPKSMRIVAIDLPEMRRAFDGECRVNPKRVFPDGVAPPKVVIAGTKKKNKNDETEEVQVIQKSLARSVIQCRNAKSKRIGVELLEMSIAELNPYNLRKTHTFGNYYWFDPGKYYFAARNDDSTTTKTEKEVTKTTTKIKRRGSASGLAEPDEEEEEEDEEEALSEEVVDDQDTTKKENGDGNSMEMVLATEEDEFDAPWNQYAWIEELKSRTLGYVHFGAPLEPSSRLTRIIFGNVYKHTVPSSRRLYEWFLPPFFQRDPAGVDGEQRGTKQRSGGLLWPKRRPTTTSSSRSNWASQKPHAVIAHGAAMQRVPGSMKYLTECCKEADVPLYIINDPRVWGGNTHSDMTEALKDMRRTVKGRIVAQVLQEQGGAFARGRLVGQMETEAKWQAKELRRRTQQRLRQANQDYQRERENNWSKLDAEALKEKLMERGVVVIQRQGRREQEAKEIADGEEGGGDKHAEIALVEKEDTSLWTLLLNWWRPQRPADRPLAGEATIVLTTDGLLQLCRQCVDTMETQTDAEPHQREAETELSTPPEVDGEKAGVPIS